MRVLSYILIALFLLSCEHKELCYHHPHTANVRIDSDWSLFEEEEVPTGMTVMIYPQDGGSPVRHSTNTIDHAIVSLPAGMYNTIVYNQSENEFTTISFEGMDSFSTAKVAANTATSRWYESRAGAERLVMQTEPFGTDCYTDAIVTQEMVESTGEDILASSQQKKRINNEPVIATHIPEGISYQISVKIHIKGIYNLRSVRASLKGVAGSYSLSEAAPTNEKATLLLEKWSMTHDEADPTKGYITAEITSLGLPKGHSATASENLFTASILLVDNKTIIDMPFEVGDKWQKEYDEQGNPKHKLYLELWADTTLPDVKPADSGDGGFDATVEDWGDEENVDLGV